MIADNPPGDLGSSAPILPPELGRDRVIRGGAVTLAGTTVIKLANLALVAIIVRRLPQAQYAGYTFAIQYMAFFAFFADLGFDSITTRELAARDRSEEGRVVGSALVAKSAVLILTLGVAIPILGLYAHTFRLAGLIAVIGLTASVPGTLALPLYARVRLGALTGIQLASTILMVVLVGMAVRSGWTVTGLLGIQTTITVGTGFALAILGRRAMTAPLHFDRATVWQLVRSTLPLTAATVAVVIYRRIDGLLLAGIGSTNDIASYGNAVKLVDALNLIPTAIATVALPALASVGGAADTADRQRRISGTGLRLLASVILPVAALGTASGGTLLAVVFGEPYRAAAPLLSILLWAHFFGFTGVMVQQALVARHRIVALAALTATAAVVNVTLNAWLIPIYGARAAAWASLAAYALPFVFGSFLPKIGDAFRDCFVMAIRPGLAAVAVLGVLVAVHPGRLALLPVFAVTSVVALLAFKATTIGEIRGIVSSVARRAD